MVMPWFSVGLVRESLHLLFGNMRESESGQGNMLRFHKMACFCRATPKQEKQMGTIFAVIWRDKLLGNFSLPCDSAKIAVRKAKRMAKERPDDFAMLNAVMVPENSEHMVVLWKFRPR